MSNTKPIIIPLQKSTNATRSFQRKNLIQQKSFEKIANIIVSNLEKITKDDKGTNRHHETITLLGQRGSGKTSFLLNLEYVLKNLERKKSRELSFLDILDPTLFEDKQHVLLTIISIISNKVYEYEENKQTIERYKDEYIKSFNNLAEGINLLDGIDSQMSHKSIWDDATINFNKGLIVSKKGLSFEDDFKYFIRTALKFIDRKMFILSFDDIDTNTSKGWPVLEVIRKYLTTLELQVIVSGDWTLFSKLVRIKQFENLKGLNNIEEGRYNETHRMDKFQILDKLEEQYLTKILKPENRIMLQNLASVIKEYPLIIVSKQNSNYNVNTDNILHKYTEIISTTLNIQQETIIKTLSFIFLSLPLRSNIQLLNAFDQSETKKLILIDEIGKQFLTHLSRFNISYDDLVQFNELEAIPLYLQKALEISKLGTNNLSFTSFLNLGSFIPYANFNNNILFYILRIHLTTLFENNLGIAIEWMLKIELFRLELEMNNQTFKKNLHDDLQFLGLNTHTNPSEFIIKFQAYLTYQETEQYDKRTSLMINGFTRVYKDRSKKKQLSYDYFFNQLTTLEKSDSYILLTYLMFNKLSLERGSKFDLYGSFYFILGFIAELIQVKLQNQDIKVYLSQKKLGSSISPYSNSNLNSNIFYDFTLDNIDTQHNIIECELIQDLILWLEDIHIVKGFPIEVLRETMNDYYWQENKMEEEANFGNYIKLQVLYFLNALLKIDLKYSSDKNIAIKRINNVKAANNSFNDKLNKIKKEKNISLEDLKLFSFIYKCPIWNYLIGLHDVLDTEALNISKNSNSKNTVALPFSDEEMGVKLDRNEHQFFNLLNNLKTHAIDRQIYKYTVEDLVKLFNNNKDYLPQERISSEEQITNYIEEVYKNIIKKNIPMQRFTASKLAILHEAILKYNELNDLI